MKWRGDAGMKGACHNGSSARRPEHYGKPLDSYPSATRNATLNAIVNT
jgi:hypothetical protein